MKINTNQITLIAVFLMLCLVVPMVFHPLGAGQMFLPMFLPIILSGFIIEFPIALIVGFLAPWISAFITGMPPLFPTAPLMSIEGLVAVTVVSYPYHNRRLNFWFCLITAVIAERIVLAIMIILVVPFLGLPPKLFSLSVIVYSIPGIILQLTVIPIILKTLWKLNIVERKS